MSMANFDFQSRPILQSLQESLYKRHRKIVKSRWQAVLMFLSGKTFKEYQRVAEIYYIYIYIYKYKKYIQPNNCLTLSWKVSNCKSQSLLLFHPLPERGSIQFSEINGLLPYNGFHVHDYICLHCLLD